MEPPALSIVAPVYNEGRIVTELVARCIRAAHECNLPFELVIVDDASTDDTPTLLATLARDPHVRNCRLAANAGQFRATQEGLRQARGALVVVLDGDLQDPPEHIPRLVDALSAAPPSVVAVLAVKSHRQDPVAFMIGQFVFHQLLHAVSRVDMPRGAGSFCIMRNMLAQRIAMAELTRTNLSAVIAVAARALGGELAVVPYDKGPRYDASGRVGWKGLVAEAIESLAVTGALSRLLLLAAIALGIGGLAIRTYRIGHGMLAAALCAAALALWASSRARRALACVRTPLPHT